MRGEDPVICDSMILQANVPPGHAVHVGSADNEIWTDGVSSFFPRRLVYIGSSGMWLSAMVDGSYCDLTRWLPLDSYVPGCPQDVNWTAFSPERPLMFSVQNRTDKPGHFLVRLAGEIHRRPWTMPYERQG